MTERSTIPIFLIQVLLFGLLIFSATAAEREVVVVRVSGPITSATEGLIREAIERAQRTGAEALVLVLDTPGGLLDSTFKIIEIIERSGVPVVAYVYPPGAKAWSAGTFILMASHVAAMAPNTIIGSAQPVTYSPLGGGQPVNDTKTINALTAFMVEKARMHGRNETAARLFIETNLNLNDEGALEHHVIEVRAANIEDLTQKLHQKRIIVNGSEVVLDTRNVVIKEQEASIRLRILTIISDPLLSSLALLVGLYALVLGFSSPGHGSEIIGAFLLILGLLGLGLNVSIASLLLIALGAILMIAEAYTPGFGLLGTAGVIFVILGSLFVIPFESTEWIISAEWYNLFVLTMLTTSAIIGAFTLFMAYKVVTARRRKPVHKGIIGEMVEVVEDIEPGQVGFVKYVGEYWKAMSQQRVKSGQWVKVVGKQGPILTVSSLEASTPKTSL